MTLLQGIRVVELSGSGAAAMTGKYFADWGADVTVLEPAEGSPLRQAPPYYTRDGERRSATWAWLSRGKASLRAGAGTMMTAPEARTLCEGADVLLLETELTEAVLDLQPAEVRPYFEGKTTCILFAPFATDGPYAEYAATDLGLCALGGWMMTTWLGELGREPVRPGVEMTPRYGGFFGFVAALIALRHRDQGGAPQFVDLSLQAVATHGLVAPWLVKSMLGIEQQRNGSRWPSAAMECADGWVGCAPLTATHWEMMCHLMGIEDVLDQPGGRLPNYRLEHGPELYERVKPWLKQRTRFEVFEQAQLWRIPSAPVETVPERLDCPQLNARGFWLEAEIDGKIVKVPRVPNLIRGAEPVQRGALVESGALGAHAMRPYMEDSEDRSGVTDVTPGENVPNSVPTDRPFPLSRSAAERTGGRGRGLGGPGGRGPTPRPLDGLRVLDLTWFWAGPFASMLLGALGADVLKIESIQRPDPYRLGMAPAGADHVWERSSYWNDTNSNKRGVTLDLNSAAGKELLERLAGQADIVISNYANRVMPNLGLTPEHLLEINPRLLVVTMPGYGPGGPWEDYVGYGVSFEQLAVAASLTGYPDGPPFIMGGVCDPIAGLHAVMSVLLALRLRERTGRGTAIEVPQCETMDSLFAPEAIAVQHGAPVPVRHGNTHEWMAPHNAYQVAGLGGPWSADQGRASQTLDDNWLTIAISSDAEFAALVDVLGRPELAQDPRFATVASRKQNEPALDRAIAEAVRGEEQVALERRLQGAGVKACRVSRGWAMPDDEGLKHIGFFNQMTRPLTGTHPQKGWPFRFSDVDVSLRLPPPLLGQHTEEVLSSLLGLKREELDRLAEQRVIGTVPLGAE